MVDSSDVLFFFGAGASAPFGIPTMKQFVIDFETFLEKNGTEMEKKVYSNIKEVLGNYLKKEVDLEDIFTVIDGLINFNYERLGLLSVYYFNEHLLHPSYSIEANISTYEGLREKFQDFIKEKCLIPKNSFTEISTVYQDFFNKIYEKSNSWSSDIHKGENCKYCTTWSMFTTNYDVCLEYYWREKARIPLNTGFHTDEIRKTQILNSKLFFENGRNSERPKLIKLHGSINWLIESDGTITEQLNIPTYTFVDRKYIGELMVYPIQQKELYIEPYIPMFYQLNDELKNKSNWIIIGYSFNDPVIREIFLKNSNEKKNIILVHPHANEIKNEKLKDIKCKKFSCLEKKFGMHQDYQVVNKSIADFMMVA